ncbi:MAG: hypothetical protein K6G22_00855 [Lachnospiraceae bacterium]|nr:hypothetical protein [Lachnospiraceae bacterium]
MASGISLLYPEGYESKTAQCMKNYDFLHSLQIDDMIVIKKTGYRGVKDIDLKSLCSIDTEVLKYRLDVVGDLVENDRLFEIFNRALVLIYDINDMKRAINVDFTTESALTCIRHLEMYQEIVDLFAEGFKDTEVSSVGMKRFKDHILSIYNGDDYKNLCLELSAMETRFGNIRSITVGVNVDSYLQPKEAGILSINEEEFKEGTIIDRLIKKNNADPKMFMSGIFPLIKGLSPDENKAFNHSVSSALNRIYSKAIRDFEPLVNKYFNTSTADFVSILDDIRFLTAGVSFIRQMKELGFDMCKPEVRPVDQKKCDLTGVYNPILARRKIEEVIVLNDFSYDENGRFYLVTGPNHGGKSIFAYSVGMAQALFQLGLFVPAKSAAISPVTGIFTHFPASDENNYGKGRLESECERLSGILKNISDTDVLFMDESFSSTSGLEGGYIASEVLSAIGVIGCGGIYVTHIHELAAKCDEYNSHEGNRGKIDNLVAVMEDKQSGKRSYRVIRTTPDGLSYAKDIARKYGLDYEGIIGNGP